MFTIEPGHSRPTPLPSPYRVEHLSDDLSVFVPADFKGTPKKTRASIYSAARYRQVPVEVHATTEGGAAGFRVFRRAAALLASNNAADGDTGGQKAPAL